MSHVDDGSPAPLLAQVESAVAGTPRPESRGNTRRAAQASATRNEIIDAAKHLMLEHGYIATSIGMIATDAGVAIQTIYNSVGNKADVLAAVLDHTASGPGTAALMTAGMRSRVSQARNPTEIIRILADWFALVNERTAGVLRVISEAAATDADVSELERRLAAARLHNYGEAASALRAKHGLRSGVTDHEAAAAIWAIGHPQVYRTLVVDLGWSADGYREWLSKTLRGTLA